MAEDYTAHEKEIETSDRINHPYADEMGVEWTV